MALKPKNNKTTSIMRDQKLTAGIEKHLSNAPLIVAGRTYAPLEIIAMISKRFDAARATALARAAWLSRVNEERAIEKDVRELRTPLRQLVVAMFGDEHETLADFGLVPRKRTASPAAVKALGAERARATRAARHTIGPKKRLAIKGQPVAKVPAAITRSDNGVSAKAVNGQS